MMLEPYEAFYDRLDTLPPEVWFEVSVPDEDEDEHGCINEDGEA